ncbi:hypothetical protein RFI_16449, partial [Reticulomyxa filosa]
MACAVYLCATLASGSAPSAEAQVVFQTKSPFGGKTKFVITEEDFVDDMELDFFHHVDDLLNDYNHHFLPWTAFILIWIVRRDNMEHIGGAVEQQSPINAVLEFMYLFSKGCFQHLSFALQIYVYAYICTHYICICNTYETFFCFCYCSDNNKVYRILLAALYHIADSGPRSKMCLSACRVLADARIEHLDKIAVSEFLDSQTWLLQ